MDRYRCESMRLVINNLQAVAVHKFSVLPNSRTAYARDQNQLTCSFLRCSLLSLKVLGETCTY